MITCPLPCREELMPGTFGEWLSVARAGRGLSVRSLAAKAGISHATISKIEDNLVGASREMVKKIAVALEVPTSEAIGAWLEDDMQEGGAIRYVTDPDAIQIVEAYEGLPDVLRTHTKNNVLSAAELAREMHERETHGARRSDQVENPTRQPED